MMDNGYLKEEEDRNNRTLNNVSRLSIKRGDDMNRGNMFSEVEKSTVGSTKRVSVKFVTEELSEEDVKKLVSILLENVREDNDVVNLYLYKHVEQKETFNCYCRVQWSNDEAQSVPQIQFDEICDDHVYLKWMNERGELKEMVQKEEN